MFNRHIAYYGLTDILNNLFQKSIKDPNAKFHHLHRIIISEPNIRLAIKLVSENEGRNTAGIDGESFIDYLRTYSDEQIIHSVRGVLLGKRKPKKVRSILIPKKNGKNRLIGIISIRDRIAQQAILNVLIPIVEARLSKNTFGFRVGLSTKHAFAKIVQALTTFTERWVVDIDLKSYFDTIPLDRTLQNLRDYFGIEESRVLTMIKRIMWTDKVMPDKSIVRYEGIGLPQGSILGPILSNVLLHSLDMKLDSLREKFENSSAYTQLPKYLRKGTWQGLRKKRGLISIYYKRYADDIRLLTHSEIEAKELVEIIQEWCNENKITLSQEKTEIYSLPEINKLKFVGYQLTKKLEGLVFSPTDQKEIQRKVKEKFNEFCVKGHPSTYIAMVTTLICTYDICTNLKWLCDWVLQLAYRRTLRKKKSSIGKLRKSYLDGRIVYLLSDVNNPEEYVLDPYGARKAYKVSVRDYMKVPYFDGYANDTDRTDCNIFLENYSVKKYNSRCLMYLPGLLHKQKFQDPVSKRILRPGEIEIHHKIPRSKGGTDDFNNLVVLENRIHHIIHKPDYSGKYVNNKAYKNLIKLLKGK
jgi:group II intron reverse transcriptase/maturase